MPILDGQAVLYSFVSIPEVRIGVAFGSGGSQSLPATELPGVSSWLDKVFTDTLVKTMVEPRRRCYSLPAIELRKKMKYVADDSTTFWAIGHDSGVIAKHIEVCGEEVEMVIPFEGVNSGELTVRLVLKEWQFSDGSNTLNTSRLSSHHSSNGSSTILSRTGRKISITIVEGKDLIAKDKSGKCDPYVKLQYGKALQRTRAAYTSTPIWNQKFEFDEIGGGEYLKIKCYSEEIFGDDNMGCARVNLEGLVEGSIRDVWVPLEQVNSGEIRLQIEAVRVDDHEGSRDSPTGSGSGWIELVLIEAKDLVGADLRGTSDPYVRVQYGNMKKRTKIMYKNLNPKWNQTLEFPDDGSPLVLHVKDHNAVLPTSNIGDCVVEYQRLPPNQMSDKWIPLQGVKRGEIHIQITRKVPELQKKPTLDSEHSLTRAHQISSQMKHTMHKCQSLIEDGNLEGLTTALSELESLEDLQGEYTEQLEIEQTLLISKITELGQEVLNTSPPFSRRSSGH
ncbi:Synaptotagmin-5 [Morella rubra]|uniref:Synaptotagmin-5 n=1 Tax=Morella rubra TaxID=262757 RepID=A0A6A1VI15_9ROSI|nr:Synaptotagmin-5 [Morella rubra]